jgi:hypothetical protein
MSRGAPTAELHKEIEKAGREMREWLAGGLGAGSTQEWLRRFHNAVAAADMGRELDYWYNSARKQVVEVFGGIDAALGRSVDRLWGEVADTLRVELSDALVVAGPDHRATLLAFADTARRGGARALGEATDRLLNLPTDYSSTFLRVGRPVIREIGWGLEEPGSELGAKIAGGVAGAATDEDAAPAAAYQHAAGGNVAADRGAARGLRVGGAGGHRGICARLEMACPAHQHHQTSHQRA